MNEEQEIDLHQFLNVLNKRKWLITAITLITTLFTAAVYFLFITPTYEAVTRIVIVKESAKIFYEDKYTQSDILMYQKLLKTYIEIAKSDKVVDKTIQGLSQYTSSEIRNSLNAVSKADTQILELRVKNSKPDVAANIANLYAKNFIEESSKVLPAGELTILDIAKTPESPVSPKKMLRIAISFCISLMASVGLAFLLEYMDTKIRTEEQIEKHLNLQVLGVISNM